MYQKAKIYKIVDNTNGNIYIGSTTQSLHSRLGQHRNQYKNTPEKNGASGKIIVNGDYRIELIENYPCETNIQLIMREQYFLDMIDNVNIKKAYITKEQYLARKREQDKKRTRDTKPYQRARYAFRASWGPEINCLLNIGDVFNCL